MNTILMDFSSELHKHVAAPIFGSICANWQNKGLSELEADGK